MATREWPLGGSLVPKYNLNSRSLNRALAEKTLAVKHQKVYCNDFLVTQILSQPTAYSLCSHLELNLGQIAHLKANSGEIRLGGGRGVLNFQQGVERCVFISATESLNMYLKYTLKYY